MSCCQFGYWPAWPSASLKDKRYKEDIYKETTSSFSEVGNFRSYSIFYVKLNCVHYKHFKNSQIDSVNFM